jgi:hypothetical protein
MGWLARAKNKKKKKKKGENSKKKNPTLPHRVVARDEVLDLGHVGLKRGAFERKDPPALLGSTENVGVAGLVFQQRALPEKVPVLEHGQMGHVAAHLWCDVK